MPAMPNPAMGLGARLGGGGASSGNLASRLPIEQSLPANMNRISELEHGLATGEGQPGMLQALLDPRMLLTLAAAGAALATKDPNAMLAGGMTAMGGLTNVMQAPERMDMQYLQEIDRLTGMVEKQQNRLTTLLGQQAQLFVGNEGENLVPPDKLGALLGLGVDIDPAAMIRRARASDELDRTYTIGTEILRQGQSVNDVPTIEAGLRLLSRAGNLGWTNETIAQLARTTGRDNIIQAMIRIADPMSVRDAIVYADDHGFDITDPEVWKRLRPVDPEMDSMVKSMDDKIKLDAYNAMAEFQKFVQANPEPNRLNQIQLFKEFFAERPAELAAIQKIFTEFGTRGNVMDDQNIKAIFDAMGPALAMNPLMSGALTDPNQWPDTVARLLGGAIMVNNTGRDLYNLDTWRREQDLEAAKVQRQNSGMTAEEAAAVAEDALQAAWVRAQQEGYTDLADVPPPMWTKMVLEEEKRVLQETKDNLRVADDLAP